MKRFHVHITVPDISAGVTFYTGLFGQAPSVLKDDYAKWLVDDPRLNFAISAHGAEAGIDHLGIQVDSDDELAVLRSQLELAGANVTNQPDAKCCYASSNKHWTEDPAGVPWEAYHTLSSIPTYGANAGQRGEEISGAACSSPRPDTSGARKACC
ncbi:ArsI/CadI family heavy metal resistance metalloenzyme [Pandoraea pnomenusa]|uniref:ArsI/CadI family heavy metal resistance metalloenzyme n=1 Tax=Pandoraea pnomenusa TaxID=93220 RepID=UPI003340C991